MLICILTTSTLGVAVLNDHIYAVGGFDGSCGLNTAEVILQIYFIMKASNLMIILTFFDLYVSKGSGHVSGRNS